jgi:TrmH family RNA methyltransferase
MSLSKIRIKYLSSLKIKKLRDSSGQFIIEGDKIIRDLLTRKDLLITELIATSSWISRNHNLIGKKTFEIIETGELELARISSFETPPPVIALINIPKITTEPQKLADLLSIGLDGIQDPGNLGTIIRTADWFGIGNIVCSHDCADCFNPKVIQASMGAIMNVSVHYVDLRDTLQTLSIHPGYTICGTFMKGESLFSVNPFTSGLIMFGNEARGISKELDAFISKRITIPSPNQSKARVESLNVASAVAISCSWIVQK